MTAEGDDDRDVSRQPRPSGRNERETAGEAHADDGDSARRRERRIVGQPSDRIFEHVGRSRRDPKGPQIWQRHAQHGEAG